MNYGRQRHHQRDHGRYSGSSGGRKKKNTRRTMDLTSAEKAQMLFKYMQNRYGDSQYSLPELESMFKSGDISYARGLQNDWRDCRKEYFDNQAANSADAYRDTNQDSQRGRDQRNQGDSYHGADYSRGHGDSSQHHYGDELQYANQHHGNSQQYDKGHHYGDDRRYASPRHGNSYQQEDRSGHHGNDRKHASPHYGNSRQEEDRGSYRGDDRRYASSHHHGNSRQQEDYYGSADANRGQQESQGFGGETRRNRDHYQQRQDAAQEGRFGPRQKERPGYSLSTPPNEEQDHRRSAMEYASPRGGQRASNLRSPETLIKRAIQDVRGGLERQMSPLQGGPDHRDVSSSEGSVDRQTATPPSGYSMKQDQPFNQEGEGTMEEPDVDRESLPYMEEWVDTSSKEEIGCFFINKTTQGMPDLTSDLMSEVKPMAFSDVVIVDGLQMALVVQEECYDPADFSAMFPKDVQLTVVCPINPDVHYNGLVTKSLKECHQHRQEYMQLDDNGDYEDVGCDCPDVAQVNIVHPENSSTLGMRLLLLRYTDHLRVVLPSLPLKPAVWEQLQQLGWLCDLPTVETETDVENLKLELCTVLNSIGVTPLQYVDHIDCSKVSPCIRLMFSSPETSNTKAGIVRLLRGVPWRGLNGDKKTILQTVGFSGHKKIFPNFLQAQDLKVIHPSHMQIEESFRSSGLEKKIQNDLRQKIEYSDMNSMFRQRLFEVPGAHPFCSNVFCQWVWDEDEQGRAVKYGWMMVGSHTLVSLGITRKSSHYRLGVALLPWKDHDTNTLYMPDMQKIGLPFHTDLLRKYAREDRPFSRPSQREKTYFSVGQIVRSPPHRPFCFVDNSSTEHPLWQDGYDVLPQHSRDGVFLHADVWRQCGFNEPWQRGVFLEYTAITEHDGRREKCRINWIHRILPRPEEKQFSKQAVRLKILKKKIEDLGIKTEEDFQDYFNRQPVVGPLRTAKFMESSAKKLSMEPAKIIPREAWLERHVNKTLVKECNLEGPYRYHLLELPLEANRKQLIVM